MPRATACLLLLFCAAPARALDEEIGADTTLAPGVHRLERPLRIVADGVTLDLGEAELCGADDVTTPDRFQGIGLVVDGRKNVTIRGGRLRGFRCAVLVKDCTNVVLEGVDASGNFRQRLGSTPEREDASDWLRPHDNDRQEWRQRYGAGICIENSRDCVVRGCIGRGQQNGLLLDRCARTQVYDNDFSFNSGWGIALWRSSDNVIVRNRCDWCVRGYSHGVYDRGQDSAGFLVFEQCSRNFFYRNSATHGGDGFFLYAGNETLHATGEGGCNDNLVYNNDFSHAVANAIEATFSTGNRFIGNRCDDSNYGVWAGYSIGTLIEGNRFEGNSIAGVAIEHGMDTHIVFNTFQDNPRAIQLWWDADEDLLKTAFARKNPCLSEGYLIARNLVDGGKTGVFLKDTAKVRIAANRFEDVGEDVHTEGACPEVTTAPEPPPDLLGTKVDLEGLPGESEPFLPPGHPRGRESIFVDEWGPVDPTRAGVFPKETTGWGACTFRVLGGDDYEIRGRRDTARIERFEGGFRVVAPKEGPNLMPFSAEVEVGGESFPVRATLLRAEWRVRFWAWERDPREGAEAWAATLGADPRADFTTDRIDFAWGGGAPREGVPADRFATRAETTMTLPKGRYELRTVSDDGVRVLVDGKVVQEDWTWHGPTERRTAVDLEAGEHALVIEHFEIDGWAVLRFDLRPAP